jgi:hypothetical protein
MQNNDKIFVDSCRGNAFALRQDGLCLRLLGDQSEFDLLSEENQIHFLQDRCDLMDPDQIYDGEFVIKILTAVRDAGVAFAMKCPVCGDQVNADNVCLAFTPSPSCCPYSDTSAVCLPCNREICFCGADGWFDEDFNRVALATLQRIRTLDGEEFFREIDETDVDPLSDKPHPCESSIGDSVLWQARVYDLVWSEELFCRKYRQSVNIDDDLMSRNSKIAYDLICAIGEEIR